jgi:hypothetical protein
LGVHTTPLPELSPPTDLTRPLFRLLKRDVGGSNPLDRSGGVRSASQLKEINRLAVAGSAVQRIDA